MILDATNNFLITGKFKNSISLSDALKSSSVFNDSYGDIYIAKNLNNAALENPKN